MTKTDKSDNEDVPMVTDASSSSQETSLVVHVAVPSQEEPDIEKYNWQEEAKTFESVCYSETLVQQEKLKQELYLACNQCIAY